MGGGTISGSLTVNSGASYPLWLSSSQRYLLNVKNTSATAQTQGWWLVHDSSGNLVFHADSVGDRASLSNSGAFNTVGAITQNGSQVLHAGNYSSYAQPVLVSGTSIKTINGVSLLGSGDIAVGAGTVTGLTLNSSSNAINPDNVTQNQIGYNTSVSLFGQTDGGLYSSAYSSVWIHQIYGDFRTGQIATRGKNNGTWQAWRTQLDSGNYSSYALPLGGGTLTGALNIYGGTSGWGSVRISGDSGWGGTNNYPAIGSNGSSGSLIMLHNPHIPWRTDNAAGGNGGTAGRSGLRCTYDAAASGWWDIGLYGDAFHIYRGTSGVRLLNIDSSGNGTFAGTVYAPGHQVTSDAKLKTNVQDSSYGLNTVLELRSVKYVKNEKEEIGLIAQEVEKITPEFVSETEDGIKTVNYAQMVSVLVKAVQELKAEVDDLRSQLGK